MEFIRVWLGECCDPHEDGWRLKPEWEADGWQLVRVRTSPAGLGRADLRDCLLIRETLSPPCAPSAGKNPPCVPTGTKP